MKTKLKLFFGVLTLSIFFVACDKSNNDEAIANVDDAITEEPIADAIEMGTVSLKSFVKDVIQVQTGKAPTLDEILDDLPIHIYSIESAMEVVNTSYRDLPELIELPPGEYKLVMFTTLLGSLDSNRLTYGFDSLFFVSAGTNTEVNAELSLLDVVVTFNFAIEVETNYPQISARATVQHYLSDGAPAGSLWRIWGLIDNGGSGHFQINRYDQPEPGLFENFTPFLSDLIVEITAIDPVTSVEIKVSKTYPGIVANQHYNINIEYTSPSTASLNITLGNENVIDDTITFPN